MVQHRAHLLGLRAPQATDQLLLAPLQQFLVRHFGQVLHGRGHASRGWGTTFRCRRSASGRLRHDIRGMAGASGWKRQSDTQRLGRGEAASAHTPVRSGESAALPGGLWVGATGVALGGHPTSPSLRARSCTPRAGQPPARCCQGASQLPTSPWRGALRSWRRGERSSGTGGGAEGSAEEAAPGSFPLSSTLIRDCRPLHSGTHARALSSPLLSFSPRLLPSLRRARAHRGASRAALQTLQLLPEGLAPPRVRLSSSSVLRCARCRS